MCIAVRSSLPYQQPVVIKISEPTTTSGQAQRLTPYQKGQEGVKRAIAEFQDEGGVVIQKEVTVELNGIRNRFDFVGEKDDNVLQQIEFQTSYYHPIKSITPHIGVLYKDDFNLRRKYFDLHWPFPNYKYSTYSNALMNMMDRIDWEFAKGDDITPIVNNMIESIMEIGISYIDYISDRKNFISEMENIKIRESISHKALPIAYYWEGRKDLALWRLNYYIQDFETDLSGWIKEDENSRFTRGARNALQDYLEFAEKLKKVMETESR